MRQSCNLCVCVEASAKTPLPNSICVEIEDNGGKHEQIIEYESRFKICSKCLIFGHSKDKCSEALWLPSTLISKVGSSRSSFLALVQADHVIQASDAAQTNNTRMRPDSLPHPPDRNSGWTEVVRKKKKKSISLGRRWNLEKAGTSSQWLALSDDLAVDLPDSLETLKHSLEVRESRILKLFRYWLRIVEELPYNQWQHLIISLEQQYLRLLSKLNDRLVWMNPFYLRTIFRPSKKSAHLQKVIACLIEIIQHLLLRGSMWSGLLFCQE